MVGPVLVVGTGRCGSSCLARLLETELGVWMGGPGHVRESNPNGDWENADIKRHDTLLLDGDIGVTEWRRRVLQTTRTYPQPWGHKHPAMARYLPEQLDTWPTAVLVWAQRDHGDTITAWSKWYGRPEASCRNSIRRRLRALNAWVPHLDPLAIDMTERRDEDELVDLMREYLTERGVL